MDHLNQAKRSELGGLDDDRGTRLQGGNRVAEPIARGKFQGLITPTTGCGR